jgi:tetratricopeptide (TPR) repeat protein
MNVVESARAWASEHKTSLEQLTPQQKKEVVADLAKSGAVPQAEIAAQLLPLWHKNNEERGMRFGAAGFGGGNGNAALYRPGVSALGMSPTLMLAAQMQRGAVGTYQEIPSDTKPRTMANDAFEMDKKGNSAGAVHLYEDALKLDATDPMIHNRYGLALKHCGLQREASRAIASSLALDPSYPPANYNAACLAAMKGDKETAAFHLAKALAGNDELFTKLAAGDKDFAKVGGGDAILTAARDVANPLTHDAIRRRQMDA